MLFKAYNYYHLAYEDDVVFYYKFLMILGLFGFINMIQIFTI